MTPLDLDELERLEAAATPVEWHASEIGFRNRGPHIYHPGEDLNFVCFFEDRFNQGPTLNLENAQFVAALRNAFPALVRELRARRRAEEAMRYMIAATDAALAGKTPIHPTMHFPLMTIGLEKMRDALSEIDAAAPAKGGEGEK